MVIKKKLQTSIFLLVIVNLLQAQPNVISIYDSVIFYDGYAKEASLIKKIPENVRMLSTSLYTTQLSLPMLQQIGNKLTLRVLGKAACDNYDRIGNVNLVLLPKQKLNYELSDTSVEKIEIARFISPFMNKNKNPDTVGYYYDISPLAKILTSPLYQAMYNFWVEFEFFGVPYAAQKQVQGCKDCVDVWCGTLQFLTTSQPVIQDKKMVLIPVSCKFLLNNFAPNATDTIGKTVKTFHFTTSKAIKNAVLYLITSNHGANEGGEEYSRRNHYIYVDNKLTFSYKPGLLSCEPYRVYNTQGNGIYGRKPQTNEEWQAFSNWCPGAPIPIRTIRLGKLKAGKHSIKITVPDAVFVNKEGYIPASIYVL